MTIQNFSLGSTGGIAAGAGSTATFDLNGAGAAPAADVAHFDRAMSADTGNVTGKVKLEPLAQTGGSLSTMGARIVESFNSMSNNYETVMKRVSGTVASGAMETVQLVQNLTDVMELSTTTGLVSKVAGKAVQTPLDLAK